MGSSSEAFTFFPQNDQVCPLCRPHLCLGLFGVLLPRALPLQGYNYNYNYNYTSTLQKASQEGSPTRTLPPQTYNHNYNYTSTLQKVPKEGGPPRAKSLQTYNYNNTNTLQKIDEKRIPVSAIKANR